jgi:hypothetical protein
MRLNISCILLLDTNDTRRSAENINLYSLAHEAITLRCLPLLTFTLSASDRFIRVSRYSLGPLVHLS